MKTKIQNFHIILHLLLPLVAFAFPISSYAARPVSVSVNNLLYRIDTDSNTAEVYDHLFTSSSKINLVIPDHIEYSGSQIPVTSIGINAFSSCRGLTSLTIGDSVTSIGDWAFSECSGLTSLTIGDSVTSIGDWAFYYCSGLTSLTIPDSVTVIGEQAFIYCRGMTSLTIGNSITEISNSAFASCSGLTSLTIPDSVTSIGNSAFRGCTGLTSLTIPESVTSIGGSAFAGCSGLTSLIIPGSVTEISNSAFDSCSGLTSLTISNSVTSIGDYAFRDCSGLTSLTIGNSVTSIGSDAFRDCSGLTSLTIGNSVTSIGSNAFSGCSGLKEVTIADGVENLSFGANVFSEVPIETLYLGRNFSCTSSSNSKQPFHEKTSLNSLTIGDSVTKIGSSVFYGCSGLTSLTIGNSVTSIGNYAFWGCSGLTSLTIPDSVTEISWYAFAGCNGLTSLIIPNSVTSIDDWAFGCCSGLTSLTIPDSVTSIGWYAFTGCSALTSLTIPNSITFISPCTFSGCSGLTSLTIPNSVTSIGSDAFTGCSRLTSLTIPDSVTEIGYSAFSGCSGLKDIHIQDGVQIIGSHAFSDCTGLKSIVLPGSIRTIGGDAFKGCNFLESVTVISPIPSAIESNPFSTTFYATLTVPEGSKEIYRNHPYWSAFGTINTWGANESEYPVFVADNITYRVTSESGQTIEVAAAIQSDRSAEIVIPQNIRFNDKSYRVAGVANNGFENVPAAFVSLPATTGYVGLEAFKGCGNLKSLECNAQTPPSVYTNSFDQTAYSVVTLAVPDSSAMIAYQSNFVWSKFNQVTTVSPIESIKLDPDFKECITGEEFTIIATIYPEYATNKKLEWSSSDINIATVDQEGNVSVLQNGICEITAKATDGTGIEASCRLDVVTSISEIDNEMDNVVEVYTLSGILVMTGEEDEMRERLTPGIYIVRRGGKAYKTEVK